MKDYQTRTIIALSIVGLYLVVVLTLMVWNLNSKNGDISMFFEQINKANFLLGPVGFVMGYYFKKDSE